MGRMAIILYLRQINLPVMDSAHLSMETGPSGQILEHVGTNLMRASLPRATTTELSIERESVITQRLRVVVRTVRMRMAIILYLRQINLPVMDSAHLSMETGASGQILENVRTKMICG